MNKYNLSICIPTYKRKKLVLCLLDEIFNQLREIESDDIELIVSVNPSDENVEDALRKKYLEAFQCPNRVLYINKTNIGGVNNLKNVIQLAKGKLVWIIGDDDFILPGTIKKVISAIRSYPDITWIYINTARLNGDAGDPNSKLCEACAVEIKDSGFYKDGKKELLHLFKRLDARVLFSTSNIFLKNASLAVESKKYYELFESKHDTFFQLTGTFYSASLGGAYIIPEALIIEGESITWSDNSYYVTVRSINDSLFASKDWNYSNHEIKSVVRRRLMDAALIIWVLIFKMFFKQPKIAIKDYFNLFKKFPFLSLFMVFFIWVWVPYFFFRTKRKKARRKQQLVELKNKKNDKK